jgi:hypothetical protein
MGVDYSTLIYLPNYNMWARQVEFYPKVGPSFVGRGIFGTVSIDIMAQDGSDLSEQRTILDILEREFATIPQQFDQIYIPDDVGVSNLPGMPSPGWFEVTESSTNGGGETTLTLRSLQSAKP